MINECYYYSHNFLYLNLNSKKLILFLFKGVDLLKYLVYNNNYLYNLK